MRALLEAGVTPDAVVGASVGAINGAALASLPHLEGVERLEEVWLSLRRSQVFPIRLAGVGLALRHNGSGVVPPDGLRSVLDARGLLAEGLEYSEIPIHVVATDLVTREPVVLSRGDTVTALLASAAVPRIFPPVAVNGRLLIDGAIDNDVPLGAATELLPDEVYVIPARPGPRMFLTDFDVHVVPAVQPTGRVRGFSFRPTPALIREAYRTTCAWLESRRSTTRKAKVG